MSRDDYRPSEDQIYHHYRCNKCGRTTEIPSFYSPGDISDGECSCGGYFDKIGESYPANSDDWAEQRDPDGEWRPRRG